MIGTDKGAARRRESAVRPDPLTLGTLVEMGERRRAASGRRPASYASAGRTTATPRATGIRTRADLSEVQRRRPVPAYASDLMATTQSTR